MKQTFRGQYRPQDQEFADLWTRAKIVVDANVLLSLYAFSKPVQKTLLQIFERLEHRLWIPHQFALEYHRNRIRSICDQVENYQKANSSLRSIQTAFLAKSRHPFVSKKSVSSFEKICKEIERSQRAHEQFISNDPFLDAVARLFDGRVGPSPNDEELVALHLEARSRIEGKVPPGYADLKAKSELGAFGDFIGWKQLLNFAEVERVPVIFVTEDRKEDWWTIHKQRVVGPRPELIEEFWKVSGQQFYMYSLDQFMRRAQASFGQRIGAEVLRELNERTTLLRLDKPKNVGSSESDGDKPDGKSSDVSDESQNVPKTDNLGKAKPDKPS